MSALMALAADSAAAVKKVLVFSRCEGFNHKASIAACKEKMAEAAKKGAFDVDFSDDYASLEIANLLKYDALVLNNTTQLNMKGHPGLASSICSFVRWGGGLCVIHAGADNFYDAPKCAHLVGGRFDGHPWGAGGTWAFRVEDRESPLTAPFKNFPDGRFKRGEEIYQQASPFYERSKLHILVSLDMSDPATQGAAGQKRADKDYAVSWIRPYGRGRVFYTSFAHDRRAWDAADTRAHIFAGLAYAMGTLKADDTPVGSAANECACTPPLAEIAAEVLDKPFTGTDCCLRQKLEFLLGSALAEQAEKDGAKSVVATARKIFARKDLQDTLRAIAARVMIMDDPSAFAEVVADDVKKVRQAAFGPGIQIPAEVLVKAIDGRSPEIKCAILARLAQDGAKSCAKDVAALTSDVDEDVAAAACAALGALGGVGDVEALNALRKRGGKVGLAAEEAMGDIPGAGAMIFDFAASDVSALAVAAKRAETKLIPRWKAFIDSSDPAVRKAAWKAFGKMLSTATDEYVFAWFLGVKDEEASAAANVLWQTLKGVSEKERRERFVALWKKGSPAARAASENLLVRADGLSAFETWSALVDDAVHGKAARAAYVALAKNVTSGNVSTKAPPKSSWKGTASCTPQGGTPQFACDGNDATRWTCGLKSKGAWYALDLGSRVFVDSVVLDTAKSPLDTPAGCDVFVSDDGKNWQGPVATCDDKTVKSTAFNIARSARHLKFVAKESRPRLYWSIHEINVKAGMDPALMERIRKTMEKFEKEAK